MSLKLKAALKRVQAKFIWGSDNMTNEVGKAIYEDSLPQAPRNGRYIAAPEPVVVGIGAYSRSYGSEQKGRFCEESCRYHLIEPVIMILYKDLLYPRAWYGGKCKYYDNEE